jgi:hypothetical protein
MSAEFEIARMSAECEVNGLKTKGDLGAGLSGAFSIFSISSVSSVCRTKPDIDDRQRPK